jgi:DNA polymerase I-like protein with 3'-5' exonuclease and polymerase domains
VAHYTQAPKLLDAYARGLDTHSLFARDIFCADGHEPSPMERFIGKSSWLATVYGCSYKKLLLICEGFSENALDLPTDKFTEAFDYLDKDEKVRLQNLLGNDYRRIHAQWMFFKNVQDTFVRKNPEIFAWRDTHIARTRRIGYVVTLGGRKIEIKGIDSRDFKIRASAERRAVNYLVQGSAADIMKMIMVRTLKDLIKPKLGKVFAVVHDELLGEVYDPKSIDLIRDIMDNTVKLRNVKIESDTKLVRSWGEK